VTGVVAALHAADKIGVLGNEVNEFSLAFVAELGTKNASGLAWGEQ
jgi:hypothetical protein